MNTWYKKYSWLLFAVSIFVVDRTTKILVVQKLILNQATEVMPYFNLFFTLNSGAAFSFLSDTGGWHSWLFIVIGVMVSLVIVFWQLRVTNNYWLQMALALILGGTFGNLFDRIIDGYVVDFLDFYCATWHFPAFNFADAAICIGTAMLVIDMLRGKI